MPDMMAMVIGLDDEDDVSKVVLRGGGEQSHALLEI